MDTFQKIYSADASRYHRMISCEDCDGELAARLDGLVGQNARRVLDVGVGTGRIPLLLASRAPYAALLGLDQADGMLRENLALRTRVQGAWKLAKADATALPVRTASFDLSIAAWSLGHSCGWHPESWREVIGRALRELKRATAPGGTIVVIETLGTGALAPMPPPSLEPYYAWLVDTWGFTRSCIATDYAFDSVEQAIEYTEFFFGPELTERIRAQGWARVPEWTALFTRTL